MSKQTAVEWLENEIRKYLQTNQVMNHERFIELLKQARQIEKEQIKEVRRKALATIVIASGHIFILLVCIIAALWMWLFYSIWSLS